jgi:hypothetical protein
MSFYGKALSWLDLIIIANVGYVEQQLTSYASSRHTTPVQIPMCMHRFGKFCKRQRYWRIPPGRWTLIPSLPQKSLEDVLLVTNTN